MLMTVKAEMKELQILREAFKHVLNTHTRALFMIHL